MKTYFIGSAVIGADDFEICVGSNYRRNNDPKATTCVFELLIFEGEPDEAWVPVTDVLEVQSGLRCSITCEDDDKPKLDLNLALINDNTTTFGEFMPCNILSSDDNGFQVRGGGHNEIRTQGLVNFNTKETELVIKTDGTYLARRIK